MGCSGMFGVPFWQSSPCPIFRSAATDPGWRGGSRKSIEEDLGRGGLSVPPVDDSQFIMTFGISSVSPLVEDSCDRRYL